MVTQQNLKYNLTEEQIENMHERFLLNCKLLNYKPKGRLLTNTEAAELCGLKPNTLEQKRLQGNGPAYFQPEGMRRVLYSEVIVVDWWATSLRKSTCA